MTKPVITTRAGKGSALTWTEGDTNLTNLRDATLTVKADTGGTDVVSDLNGTVTLVAGTNVTITGDNTAKTVTIAATGGGGSSTLDGLSDVVITAAATGDMLYFDGTNWIDKAAADITVGGATIADSALTANSATSATTATNANKIYISSTDGNTSDTTLYPILVANNTTTNEFVYTDGSALSYNASTNTLTATTFSGNVTGNLTGSVSATAVTASNTISVNNTAGIGITFSTSGMNASAWTTSGIAIRQGARTYTDTSSAAGTVATSVINGIGAPTMGSTNAITITDAATLYVANKPTAGTNTTITNGWAILSAGPVKVDSDLRIKGLLEPVVDNGNSGVATLTPNAANGTVQKYTLTGNITLNAFGTPIAGQSLTLILVQDATGSRTLTSTMKWAGGTKTLSTAAGSIDIVSIFYDGTNYYASLSKGFA